MVSFGVMQGKQPVQNILVWIVKNLFGDMLQIPALQNPENWTTNMFNAFYNDGYSSVRAWWASWFEIYHSVFLHLPYKVRFITSIPCLYRLLKPSHLWSSEIPLSSRSVLTNCSSLSRDWHPVNMTSPLLWYS